MPLPVVWIEITSYQISYSFSSSIIVQTQIQNCVFDMLICCQFPFMVKLFYFVCLFVCFVCVFPSFSPATRMASKKRSDYNILVGSVTFYGRVVVCCCQIENNDRQQHNSYFCCTLKHGVVAVFCFIIFTSLSKMWEKAKRGK